MRSYRPTDTRRWRRLRAAFPRGGGLPTALWLTRHSAIRALLVAHLLAIPVFGVAAGVDGWHLVGETAVLAAFTMVAYSGRLQPRVQSSAVCLGLLSAAGILVHLSGGYIEVHFHFFVLIGLITLYQDWIPFLLSIGYVFLHHGIVGALDPASVYNHPDAVAHPWKWAAIHGAFVFGASVVGLVSWRLNELSRNEAAESGRRFRDLVQSVDAIVWEADAQTGRFTFVSEEAQRMLGYPIEAWLADSGFWTTIVHPEDRHIVAAHLDRSKRGPHVDDAEYRVIAADGRIRFLHDIVRVVSNPDGMSSQLRGIMLDLTAQRSLEEELRHAQKIDAIGRLAGGIAHDFNNLLTVISGRVQLLRHLPHNEYEGRQLDLIKSTAGRATALTKQLLAFSRKQILSPKVIRVTDMVREFEPLLRRLIGEDIVFSVRVAPDIGCIRADPSQLEQVIMNLVVNARDAMPHGGRLSVEAGWETVTAPPPGHADLPSGPYVVLRVADTGTGMDEATRAKIFEPFFTTKQLGLGTGLGLATVYGIVKQTDGHIHVESEVGAGTRFTLYFPRVASAGEGNARDDTTASLPQGRGTILVVEDEEGVRDLAAEILQGHGYQVITAGDAKEALLTNERLNGSARIDLLLADVVMPGMSGAELAAELTRIRPGMRVLYMSGYSDNAISTRGTLLPGTRLLEKPFTDAELLTSVSDALGESALKTSGQS
jgi:two-component system, cell cycle sensor histidine kinase and response regulator CckA